MKSYEYPWDIDDTSIYGCIWQYMEYHGDTTGIFLFLLEYDGRNKTHSGLRHPLIHQTLQQNSKYGTKEIHRESNMT